MEIVFTKNLSADEYNILHRSVGWGKCIPEKVNMALERSEFLTVARTDGEKAVGMARFIYDGLQILLMDVIVMPEYQGRGIGKRMMQDVMDYIRILAKSGGIKINLVTAPDKAGFYEKFGFTARPTETLGPGMTQWIERGTE